MWRAINLETLRDEKQKCEFLAGSTRQFLAKKTGSFFSDVLLAPLQLD